MQVVFIHKHRFHRRDAKNAEKFFNWKKITLRSLRLCGEHIFLLTVSRPDACRLVSLFFHRTLGELALQGAAVHFQRARRCRDIAVMFQQHLLEVLPFQSPY